MHEVVSCLAVMLFTAIAYLGGCVVFLTIYDRLFGILYRHVSEEYAEPVSFWLTLSLALSGIGWVIHFFIKVNF
jgi:hypothetical protein